MYQKDPKFEYLKTIKQAEVDRFKANAARVTLEKEQFSYKNAINKLGKAVQLKEQQRQQNDYIEQQKAYQEQQFNAHIAQINANKHDGRVQIFKNELEVQISNQNQVATSRALANYYDQVRQYNQQGLYLEGAVRLQEIKNTVQTVKAAKIEQLRSQYENSMRDKQAEQIHLENLAKQKQMESLSYQQQKTMLKEAQKATAVKRDEALLKWNDLMGAGSKKKIQSAM